MQTHARCAGMRDFESNKSLLVPHAPADRGWSRRALCVGWQRHECRLHARAGARHACSRRPSCEKGKSSLPRVQPPPHLRRRGAVGVSLAARGPPGALRWRVSACGAPWTITTTLRSARPKPGTSDAGTGARRAGCEGVQRVCIRRHFTRLSPQDRHVQTRTCTHKLHHMRSDNPCAPHRHARRKPTEKS